MTDSQQPLKVAIAGLGTVGAGVMNLLDDQADVIRPHAGRGLKIVAVSARDRRKQRGLDLDGIAWYDDAVAMARDADADVVVELIGGSDGPAKAVCEAAIDAGRGVVSANKALLAMHGTDLARRAEEKGVVLAYEAAVCGGIPIIKTMREGLVGNSFSRVYGILNGTCNYILSTMRDTGRLFDDVLTEAQDLGYAEADPSVDIDGFDAAHKLAILTSLAFGTPVNYDGVHVEGIRGLETADIEYAAELGFRVKLLGIASLTEHGIEQRVHPTLVPLNAPIAYVEDVFNAVVTEGDYVGRSILEGRGAGAGPTASAVVADLVDIACDRKAPAFGIPVSAMEDIPVARMDQHRGAFYLRLMVEDRPGVFAEISSILHDEKVSMESILQRGRAPGETVPVVMTVYDTEEAAMKRAVKRIEETKAVTQAVRLIRIEHL